MPSVLVPIAEGVEEIEVVTIIDVLRRARWDVVAAAVHPGPAAGSPAPVTASRGVRIVPDAEWASINPLDFDLLVLPGGAGGTDVLKGDARVLDAVRGFVSAGKLVGAICAAPLVLQAAGVLNGRKATCHPSVRAQLTSAQLQTDAVVVDGGIMTSQGPGTAIAFALALIRRVAGPAAAETVAKALVLP